jgi:glycosyltransferase involved in cell wall biosynthesis
MKFSVIIPAYNAAETISATLDSLQGQSYSQWEAVIVDDGSTDTTTSVANRYCNEDKRFSVVQQSNAGLSAARNTGIAAASNEYLLFLDSDDWIHPAYLERFAQAFVENPEVDAIVCGWQFMLEDGTSTDIRYPPDVEDMFPFLSHTCPFIVHACVINRQVIENAGVFDNTVGYVEDWDFWQRVSRSGARFKRIHEVLAFYRMRKGSLSRKVYKSYNDACKMIHRGYAPDQRVRNPLEIYQNGMPDNKMYEHLCWLYCWYAGLCLGVGESINEIPEPELPGFKPDPQQLASFLFEGVYRGGCFLPGEWMSFYHEHKNDLEKFFEQLVEKTGITSCIRDSDFELCTMIAKRHSGFQKQMVGPVLYSPIDVNKPVEEPTPALRVILSVWLSGLELGKIELSGQNNDLSTHALKQAVGEEFSWPIMTNYLRCRNQGVSSEDLEGSLGWELFLRELWGITCAEADFYDKTYDDGKTYDTRDWCDHIRVDVEDELFHIENEAGLLTVDYYIGGSKVSSLVLNEEEPVIKAQVLRAAISAHGKFELCKAAVIQGLIGKEFRSLVLREELRKFDGREI